MYRVSAGIEARKPGYKEILIQPQITKKLDYSKASFESMYGTISSGWERKDGKIILRVSIPANTRAVIMLPAEDVSKATQNGMPVVIDKNDAITATAADGSRKIIGFTRGSGDYIFEYSE
ncbi:MAG TPA: alpha-L-rhamnosidase C-terminal domain-containing protein [Bacteroidales bacterium]|nr:alpha-L-rhamnosidase C-terminal domain-containing protein [Bacteroidales bacterium]